MIQNQKAYVSESPWKNWSAGKAPLGAGKPSFRKTEHWKSTLGRWKAIPWKNWSAGKAPWGAGKVLLGKNGALEAHPVWDFKSINRDGVGPAVSSQCFIALYGSTLSKRGHELLCATKRAAVRTRGRTGAPPEGRSDEWAGERKSERARGRANAARPVQLGQCS